MAADPTTREHTVPTTVRNLTALCVALGLICASLATSWKVMADGAACWRAAFEEDDTRAA